MSVLITGASGSVGVHVAECFLNQTDEEVILLDSGVGAVGGNPARLSWLRAVSHRPWATLYHDLAADFSAQEIASLENVTTIVHLASLSDVQASIDNPVPFVSNNVALQMHMLELARKLPNLEAFLHFSTDEVYGPDFGDAGGVFQGHPEWDVILPSNPYSASKAAQEAFAIAYWRSFGVPVVITNTMNNFGFMQSPSKFPVIVQNRIAAREPVTVHVAADGSEGTRFYIDSRDVADAVRFILSRSKPTMYDPDDPGPQRPDRYNIVGDRAISNSELVHLIGAAMGVDRGVVNSLIVRESFHAHNPGHDLHYGLDGSKLAGLGWAPAASVEARLGEVVAWQTANPAWITA